MTEQAPFLEVLDKQEILTTGFRFKEEIEKMKEQLKNYAMKDSIERQDKGSEHVDAENLENLFQELNKNQEETNQKINDFEKNLGLKLQRFFEGDSDDDDPLEDAELFHTEVKSQYGEIKTNFRNVVDTLRTTEYDQFV